MNNKRTIQTIILSILLCLTVCCFCGCSYDSQIISIPKEETFGFGIEVPENFTPLTLLDDDNFFISVANIEYSDIWGYIIELFIENKTDIDLSMTLYEFALNGKIYDTRFSPFIPGASAKSINIELDYKELENYDITSIDSISFIFDANPIDEKYGEEDVIDEFAKIQKSLNASFRVFPFGKSSLVKNDDDDFEFTITSLDASDSELVLDFLLDNYKEEGLLMFEISSLTINNTVIKDFAPVTYKVGAGVSSPRHLSVDKDYYSNLNTANIKTVKFRLIIKDVINSDAVIWDKHYIYNI